MKKGKKWKKGMRITSVSLLLLFLVVFCSGCSLFPKEQEIREDLTKKSDDATTEQNDRYAIVKQGDLDIRSVLVCNGKCESETYLKFGVSGIEYGHVYVSTGDYVKKGTLLADLDMSGVDDVISDTQKEYKLKELEVQDYVTQISDLKKTGALSGMNSSELQDSLRQLEEAKISCQDEARLARARYEEAKKEKRDRQIVADKDGTVTYIYDTNQKNGLEEGETLKSNRELEFIRLSSGGYHFEGQTTDYQNFPVGSQVDMTVNNQNYKMKIVEATPVEGDEEGRYSMKLDFVDEIYDLDSNPVGIVNTSVSKLKNVLYVDIKAVVTLQGQDYVYVVDENGMRTAKKVETGLNDGTNIEIKSGVSVGQKVILK